MTIRHIWDVAIVGSGPAGAAAALSAVASRPGASVLMLDRSSFPRDKVCGDAVLSAGVAALAECGVQADDLTRGYRPVRMLKLTSARGVTVSRMLPESVTILPRAVFDARLLDAARRAGAAWRIHNVRTIHDHGSYVEIDHQIRARTVIGADGVESVVRRSVTETRCRDIAIAIRGYDRQSSDDVPRMVLDRRPGLAYAWRFPSTAGPANAGYGHLLGRTEHASRALLLDKVRQLLPALDLDPQTVRAHRLPLSTSRSPVARGNVLLVGDAAGLVNPLSGEGIYYAIMSGLAAGHAATDPGRAAQHYRAALRSRFRRHHAHVSAMDRLIRWEPILEAGLRAARAHQSAFDDVAALGLAGGSITPRLAMRMSLALVRPRSAEA